MNYKDKCRTCLGSNKDMRHIQTIILIAGTGVRLSDILEKFYSYKISPEDQFPEYICISCVHQLTVTYSFKVLIEKSAKTLAESTFVDSTSDHIDYNIEPEYKTSHSVNTRYYRARSVKQPVTAQASNILFCVECKAEFQSIKCLKEHCINNHPAKSSSGRDCDYCNEKFEDFKSLARHRKLHFKPYLCENCWEGFYSLVDRNAHSCEPKRNKKNKDEKVLRQCDQCGKSYPPGYIKIHMLTHSSEMAYSCKYCPKKFKVPGSLNSHILWNHKRTRNHICEVCNATFISSSARSSHVRKNHLKEKKYGCESCGKRFFSKSELQRHTLTHTGVKNFHCHMCDKSYQTRYGLNVHLKSHSQMTLNIM